MRTLGSLFFTLLFAGGLSAQYRGNFQSMARANFHPVYPGGSGSRRVNVTPRQAPYGIASASYLYAYPVYVPVYDSSYAAPAQPEPAPDAASVSCAVEPAPAPTPTPETATPVMHVYQTETPPAADETPAADRYLFAFKDHSIYSAVAYWVDGDTLHYFTNGSTHKQAPLSLLDRDLTERLNQDSGADLKLPPKQ